MRAIQFVYTKVEDAGRGTFSAQTMQFYIDQNPEKPNEVYAGLLMNLYFLISEPNTLKIRLWLKTSQVFISKYTEVLWRYSLEKRRNRVSSGHKAIRWPKSLYWARAHTLKCGEYSPFGDFVLSIVRPQVITTNFRLNRCISGLLWRLHVVVVQRYACGLSKCLRVYIYRTSCLYEGHRKLIPTLLDITATHIIYVRRFWSTHCHRADSIIIMWGRSEPNLSIHVDKLRVGHKMYTIAFILTF